MSAASAPAELKERIEALYALPAESLGEEAHSLFQRLLHALEEGAVRAAEPGAEGWTVNGWVKKGILLGFRLGKVVATPEAGPLRFFDKDTLLPRKLTLADGERVVPGGSAVRSGACSSRWARCP